MNDATAVFWNHLSQQLATYLPQAEREKVEKGFYLAQQIHQGKFRLDGSPYITHVLSVATILANWHAPAEILIAGLLHDALKQEYSNYPDPDFLEKQTSPQILRLIEAAISLGRYGHLMPFSPIEDLSSRESAIDHLPWAMQILSNEPMAVVIKIADRLHNFQSLAALDVTRQITYAERTKRIFVPFADRLGMRKAKRELEDRAFQVLQPNLYWRCKARYPWEKREKATSSLIEQIRQRLASFGIQTEVKLHPRNLARLNQRERLQKGRKIPLHLAQPLVVIVPDVEACYRALGILHGLWLPVPGEVRDYIAAPKTNGYRSLHTLVRLPQDGQAGGQLQILIRTREMDLVADYGVMARWLGVDEAFLPEFPQPVSVPKDKIIVFTPDGEPKELPRGATVIDFAYAVHDYLGHHYMGAMVNGRMVEPDLVLEDADVVKIRTSQASVGPSNEWLKFVKTRKARSAIRRWLKKQDPIATAQKGWDLLNAAFGKQGVLLSTSAITSRLEEVAIRMGYPSLQDLLIDVGFGQRNPEAVLQQLQRPLKHGEEVSLTPVTVLSVAESGLPRRFGACCRPMPPDEIVGYRNRRNVVTIHRANCSRIQNRKPLLHVEWRQEFEPNQWEIAIEAVDRIGLVRDLSTILAKEKINMSSFHADSMPDGSAKIQIGLTMLSRQP
ncbi:MAG: bifunctional (p)ppGpp synthetase/guanosine-3',5'-bis(diphosphate) 3'-pyrophosphohydrolase, partial [Chloroflexi bacterium]